MTKKVFDQIAEGLQEALALAKSEMKQFRDDIDLAFDGADVVIDARNLAHCGEALDMACSIIMEKDGSDHVMMAFDHSIRGYVIKANRGTVTIALPGKND